MIPGVDVSHHNGAVDWARVARAGKRFAFVKATEGVSFTDPTHARNVAGARTAGLAAGSYHFAHPSGSAVDQARHHLDVAGRLNPGRLPCALDLERTDGLTPAQLQRWAATFLHEVAHGTGRSPLLYTGLSFLHDNLADGQLIGPHRLWIARYGADPGGFAFWQSTQSGTCPGISGAVDLDSYRGTQAQLDTLAGRVTPSVTQSAPAGPAAPYQEDQVQFITADGTTIYITNGIRETRHIEHMAELIDLEHAGLAKRPAKRVTPGTLAVLLHNAR